jgi:Ni2+-binding GTPase involved in maturation of urease and hydrogenase
MKVIVIAGPPNAGKTSVTLHLAGQLLAKGASVAAVKFDARSSFDPELYTERLGIPAIGGISGYLCPDHYFISNMEEAVEWGKKQQASYLFIETAGLCLRCAPHIEGVLALTVVDSLGGIQASEKMGPLLSLADIAILTKGDLVSQAEREVIAYGISSANPSLCVHQVNGLLGTGTLRLLKTIAQSREIENLEGYRLRHDMPAGICSYCTGEKRIGRRYQSGSVEKLSISDKEDAKL